MNTHVIDVFDKIAVALLKTGQFLPDAMLQAAMDDCPTQQSSCVGLAFLTVGPK
jgi:hypothetical protein